MATCLVCFSVVACGDEKNGPKTGSNSNWLVACDTESECGAQGACLCGACSRTCGDDADCEDLGDGYCSLDLGAAQGALCGGGTTSWGMCLPRCTPGSCPLGQSCVAGGCVLAELPDSEFCAPVSAPGGAERAKEDELFSLLQENRTSGTIACESGIENPAQAPLKLDGRLRCAARIKALDQAQTGLSGMVDSVGRSAGERIDLSGFSYTSFWESYAYDTASVEQAYGILLADANSCPELGSPDYTSAGVANVDDVFVVIVARE